MKRPVAIVLAVVAVAIVGAIVLIMANRGPALDDAAPVPSQIPASQTPATSPSPEPSEPESSPTSEPVAAAGEYVEYSDTAIANASGTPLLFFHASWCIQCRAVETDIQNNGVPDGVTVIKVDYDSNQDLRQKYGVTLQTTFVRVDSSGEKVASFVAYDDPRMQAVSDALL